MKLYENNFAKTDFVRVSRYDVRNIKNLKLSCKNVTFVLSLVIILKSMFCFVKNKNEEHNKIFSKTVPTSSEIH